MKRLLTVFLTAVILLGLCIPMGEAGPLVSELATLSGMKTAAERTSAKTVRLKRGKTLNLWVYPFASTTQFYKDCGKEYPVKAIQFSGTSGKVKAKVSSGGSWLKAKKSSSGWNFYVTGRNLTLSDKHGVIRITDEEGAFATIHVTRGGIVKYSGIYSIGASIYATISASAAHDASDLYVYRWIFDRTGKLTGKKKFRVEGTAFRDTARETHLDYTYVYTVGYYPAATGLGMQTGAAAVYLSDPENNTGKVKKMTDPGQSGNAAWLYNIAH